MDKIYEYVGFGLLLIMVIIGLYMYSGTSVTTTTPHDSSDGDSLIHPDDDHDELDDDLDDDDDDDDLDEDDDADESSAAPPAQAPPAQAPPVQAPPVQAPPAQAPPASSGSPPPPPARDYSGFFKQIQLQKDLELTPASVRLYGVRSATGDGWDGSTPGVWTCPKGGYMMFDRKPDGNLYAFCTTDPQKAPQLGAPYTSPAFITDYRGESWNGKTCPAGKYSSLGLSADGTVQAWCT